ncbi:MAG: AAA family ATPase [Bacteroidia bacterium]|nr:AAA family ATPase [Bacteroidia bacterium]
MEKLSRAIFEGKKTNIFLVEEGGKPPFVVKVLISPYPSPEEIAQFYNEFEYGQNLNIEGVRKVYNKVKFGDKHAFSMEYVEGRPWKEAFPDPVSRLNDFLQVAVKVAKSLGELHRQQIIHKDINSNNILVNPQTLESQIIDLGIAVRIDLKIQDFLNPERLQGTLTYISPEQTGRMNRTIDYRSDLYSLGVTLYEILVGHPPFQAEDPMEMVHAHIARKPVSPHKIKSSIPKTLSDIIMKLLRKNAEDRYQSAFSLVLDLEMLLEGKRDFEIGQNDYSGKFQIPQKLYGRDKELAQLMTSFDHISNGGKQLLLVSGYSGVGKSALVMEVHKPITARRGNFISGKYDQFQRSSAYHAIIQAFNGFTDYLLTENKENLNKWKVIILNAVGNNGQVLIDVIPSLELVIGPQPALPKLGPAENTNRFNMVLTQFINSVSRPDHPLVLFIDDLQWADLASLNLLKNIMIDHEMENLLVIGAYRDNEVDEGHPFIIAVHELEKAGAPIEKISLGNLTAGDMNDLISESLDSEPGYTRALTELVYGKTQGNAFFSREFLKSLYTEGLLEFNFEQMKWGWDMQKIREKDMTDNVVELMAGKISGLNEDTQEILKRASCIGASFDLKTLSIISGMSSQKIQSLLWEPIQDNLIYPLNEDYKLFEVLDESFELHENAVFKFAHDRIQQAAYSLISELRRKEINLMVGELILENYDQEYIDARIGDIVNYLNAASDLIKEPAKVIRLAELNLQAGLKAKNSAAYLSSIQFFKAGIQCLGEGGWENQYRLMFNLTLEQGESEYLAGRFDNSDVLLEIAEEKSLDKFDRIKVKGIKLAQMSGKGMFMEGVKILIESLNMFDMNVPTLEEKEKYPEAIQAEFALYRKNMEGRKIEDLFYLPELTDEGVRACALVMASSLDLFTVSVPQLRPYYVTKLVNLSLQYGLSPFMAPPYTLFASILNMDFLDYDAAWGFADLARRLVEERYQDKTHASKVYHMYGYYVQLRHHISKGAEYELKAYDTGLEVGDFSYAGYGRMLYLMFYYPTNFQDALLATDKAISFFSWHNQAATLLCAQMYKGYILCLQGKTESIYSFDHPDFAEATIVAAFRDAAPLLFAFFAEYKFQVLSMFQEYDKVVEWIDTRDIWLTAFGCLSLTFKANYYFHCGISAIPLAERAQDEAEREKYLSVYREAVHEVKRLVDQIEENHLHQYELLLAEFARMEGRVSDAMDHYEASIEAARTNKFVIDVGFANELAARFYKKINKQKVAMYYLLDAHYSYNLAGINAKVQQLEKEFDLNISAQNFYSTHLSTTLMATNTQFGGGSFLDMNSLMKSAAAISGEVVLDSLLEKMLKTVAENAGAERAIFIQAEEGALVIEAIGTIDEIETMISELVDDSDKVPLSVINYVKRKQKPLVLQNATEDEVYGNDPYIRKNRPKSVLCQPVIRQGDLTGIIYLENNLATGVFTNERSKVVRMLSSQIAISIDNALLVENLEEKVEIRTIELQKEQERSEKLLRNILPEDTVNELKEYGYSKPKPYELVSVLFTDFKGFTTLAEHKSPEELVELLNYFFAAFDEIAERHHLEKIKTIGDAYMCAGGIPTANMHNPYDAVRAALEFQEFMEKWNQEVRPDHEPEWRLRIGIHSGPLVAGVVGQNKFAYDIWGDTVNLAARMESSGVPGRVNISEATYELIKDEFECTSRGKIQAKNKGEIEMYFVDRVRDRVLP